MTNLFPLEQFSTRISDRIFIDVYDPTPTNFEIMVTEYDPIFDTNLDTYDEELADEHEEEDWRDFDADGYYQTLITDNVPTLEGIEDTIRYLDTNHNFTCDEIVTLNRKLQEILCLS